MLYHPDWYLLVGVEVMIQKFGVNVSQLVIVNAYTASCGSVRVVFLQRYTGRV
ncbi:hypothetical protein MK079_00225 [Candidatus Gracilibacteria bacterium]|nr:hypothetical protein [Candidatus Gracilibacteria bacterium]